MQKEIFFNISRKIQYGHGRKKLLKNNKSNKNNTTQKKKKENIHIEII